MLSVIILQKAILQKTLSVIILQKAIFLVDKIYVFLSVQVIWTRRYLPKQNIIGL